MKTIVTTAALAAVLIMPVIPAISHATFTDAATECFFAGDEECKGGGGAVIAFKAETYALSERTKSQLDDLAKLMRNRPQCRVIVMGTQGGTKFSQQLSWDRVNAVIEYMSETNNIDRRNFIFRYEGQAGKDDVDCSFAAADEDGPSSVPPPHPDLRR